MARQGFFRLTAVQAGGAICLPMIMVGQMLGETYGLAAAITAVFDLPTYLRNGRGKGTALASVLVAFGVVLPLVEGLGIYIGLKTPGMNLLSALTMQGGAAWTLWVLLFLVLAGWTTNNANLYSAGACLDLLRPSSAKVKALALGSIGTGLALLPLLSNFEVVLNGMGTLVIAVGSTVLMAYLLRRIDARRNVLACLLGAAAGFCALSGMALIDAAVVSGLATAILGGRGDETARA
jgi:cytosine permease